jgi:hypothetical protein
MGRQKHIVPRETKHHASTGWRYPFGRPIWNQVFYLANVIQKNTFVKGHTIDTSLANDTNFGSTKNGKRTFIENDMPPEPRALLFHPVLALKLVLR